MLKDLIKVANRLDNLGLLKEANMLDKIIQKLAKTERRSLSFKIRKGETFSGKLKEVGDKSVSYEDQIKLNKEKNSAFNPDKISAGQTVWFYVGPEVEYGPGEIMD